MRRKLAGKYGKPRADRKPKYNYDESVQIFGKLVTGRGKKFMNMSIYQRPFKKKKKIQ